MSANAGNSVIVQAGSSDLSNVNNIHLQTRESQRVSTFLEMALICYVHMNQALWVCL